MDNSLISTNEESAESVDHREWVVVKTMGGGYLGKPSGIILSKVIRGEDGASENVKEYKKKILEVMSKNEVLALNPCFDFLAPLRPMQGPDGRVAMARDPVIVPFDFTTHNVPVYVRPTGVMFLADLQSEDVKTYKGFVVQTLRMQLQARAAAAGLELAGPGGLHGLPGGRGRG